MSPLVPSKTIYAKTRGENSKATQVCDKQNDDIATYISSLTLSDSSTGGISAPGGRLWSSSAQADDVDSITAYISSLKISDLHVVQGDVVPSSLKISNDAAGGLSSSDTLLRSHPPQASLRYTPINDVLSELDNIERELGSLLLAARPQLKSLATPISRDDPFPLKSAISAARLLRDRLSSITNKASSVRGRKINISDRLNAFLEDLMKSNTLWNREMKRLAKKDKELIPTYETRVYSISRRFEVTNCIVQITILRLPYQMLTQLSRYRYLPWLPSKLSFTSVVAVADSFSQCSDMSSSFP